MSSSTSVTLNDRLPDSPLHDMEAQDGQPYTFESLARLATAAITLQRAFRNAKARHTCKVALARAEIFGGAGYLREGHLPGSDSAASLGSRARMAVGSRKEWKKDKGFRQVLKNSVLEGYEDLYLHYAVIEEEIGLISRRSFGTAGSTAAGHEPCLESALLGVASGSAVQEAVDRFRRELGRVDRKFEAAVGEVVSILQLLRKEATPRQINSPRTGPQGLRAVQQMQKGVYGGLKAALQDLYKKMYVLMQIASLNYVGFRKLEIRMEEMIGMSECQRARLPTREEIRSRPFFLQMSSEASEATKRFFEAMDEAEVMYSNLFTNGDLNAARSYLRSFQNTPPSVGQSIWLGVQGGMALILLIWAGWLLLLDPRDELECPYCNKYLAATFPVFRILLVPIVGIWTWAVGVRIWEKHNVNYTFILQMDTMRYAGGAIRYFTTALRLTLMFLFCFVTYVSAIRTGWFPSFLKTYVEPTLWPVITLMIFLVYMVWPSGHSKNLSNYFLEGLAKTVIRPFGSNPVGFAENFIADILTSMVIVLRDITTVAGFYMCGGASGLPDRGVPMWLSKVQGPLITALPYFWRFMQCIRRAYDAKGLQASIPHLVNAGKYVLSLTTITMATLGCEHGCQHFYTDKEKWTIGRVTWFSALVLGTLYAYMWDIFMDWSLFLVDKSGKRWLFGLLPALQMREKRSYKATWFYYWAAVTDLGGRCMWALSINPFMGAKGGLLASPQVFTTVVAVVELLRRGQWSVLRIENEYMTNASNYRRIADVPVMITFAELRVGKKHLHTGEEEKRKITLKQSLLIALCFAMASAAVAVVCMHAGRRGL